MIRRVLIDDPVVILPLIVCSTPPPSPERSDQLRELAGEQADVAFADFEARSEQVAARLDISERRVPQDGQVTLRVAADELLMRVATVPTIRGEKMTLRILPTESLVAELSALDALGMSEGHHQMLLYSAVAWGFSARWSNPPFSSSSAAWSALSISASSWRCSPQPAAQYEGGIGGCLPLPASGHTASDPAPP